MTTICMSCKARINGTGDGPVSHGLCPACFRRMLAEQDAQSKEVRDDQKV